jgi:hypothetical protein
VLSITLLVLVAGGIASAAIPGSDGTISGCYDKVSGKLRLIDSAAGQQCTKNETPVSWQQSARLACPSGTTLSTGVCVENTARVADEHGDAEDDCADEGRRLPSPGELRTWADTSGVTLASPGEWTDDLGDIATSSTFKYFVIADNGNGVADAFDDYPYRCVAGAGIA